jgi:hypothetical protein
MPNAPHRKNLRNNPNNTGALRFHAACLGLLGRIDQGQRAVQRLLVIAPDWTVRRVWERYEIDLNHVFKTPGVVDALCEGLRRCGLPERPSPAASWQILVADMTDYSCPKGADEEGTLARLRVLSTPRQVSGRLRAGRARRRCG